MFLQRASISHAMIFTSTGSTRSLLEMSALLHRYSFSHRVSFSLLHSALLIFNHPLASQSLSIMNKISVPTEH
uniref:Uncharacterized protein n=1 Tax=Diadromus pulchellus ascovirus 4a TaxID=158683 RepID=Q9DSV5_9VIRU|nr:hypothetical protein [Diadromus pulchellus ascovirus 4a]